MKVRPFFIVLLLIPACSAVFAQGYDYLSRGSHAVWGDSEAARQYVLWAQQEINENRMPQALAGLERAFDFANVSSDISYLLAFARFHEGKSRTSVIEALDTAIEVNRWEFYNANQALVFKAQQLVAMRSFSEAIAVLNQIPGAGNSADAVMARLAALKGMAEGLGDTSVLESVAALSNFRSLLLSALDRFPRDPRLFRIFFEYAKNKLPGTNDPVSNDLNLSELNLSDLSLMELVLRRLPFVMEADPELAWMASYFIRDAQEASRLVSSYRAGGIPGVQARDFYPDSRSIPAALRLGLIDEFSAVEELFSGNRGINSPVPPGMASFGEPVLLLSVINDVYDLLGSDEGRSLFTLKLLDFSGFIVSDDDNDGIIDGRTFFQAGILREFSYDRNQENIFDLKITFLPDGMPVTASVPLTGTMQYAQISWERYPFVEYAVVDEEQFAFRPADFQYAPVLFDSLGGSSGFRGQSFPIISNPALTRRTLVSFCSSLTRPSIEFDGALERIFLDGGIPLQALVFSGELQVSLTEFENGLPVIQYADLDMDGRMETVRLFYRPWIGFGWEEYDQTFNHLMLLATSESDWRGDGRFKTGEMYLQDGSVVYLYDMDGSGTMNFSEIEHSINGINR